MDTLFPIPEQPSPRLVWLRKHGVRCIKTSAEDEPWCAWLPENDSPECGAEMPRVPEWCGYGDTEDDAIADLARREGLRLWNEESPL
jgi:hypothetical protein